MTAPPRILVLQHIACEPPGVYEDVLREHGARIARVEVDEGQALPDWHDHDAIVAMGGPMSANDEAELPWLAQEKALIREAVGAGTPFLGVCLGAQLLAGALGARVYAGPRQEVGVLPVRLTAAGASDPVLGALPGEALTLQWHGDTFELPEGAVLLASSPAYPNQAFRVRRAYGVQFHLEVSREMADEWATVPAYAESLEAIWGEGALPRLLADFDAARAEMEDHARALMEGWVASALAPARSA
jgi:GMP synthase-like glutamine amidotransferase